MIDTLTVYETNIPKVRFGGYQDGGYVLADQPHCDNLVSIGIGGSYSFEVDFAKKYNTPIYGFDPFVSSTTGMHFNQLPNAKFYPIGAGGETTGKFMTMDDLIAHADITGTNNILQMDIEGAEWELLKHYDADLYKSFSQILIETHANDFHSGCFLNEGMMANLAKINEDYYIVHIHGNNGHGYSDYQGVQIPQLMEITWLRKDLVTTVTPNTLSLPDLVLDACNFSYAQLDLNYTPFVNK